MSVDLQVKQTGECFVMAWRRGTPLLPG